jgi:hypothetical protein
MKKPMKPIGDLTEEDLKTQPVWDWATLTADEELSEIDPEWDETYITPLSCNTIPVHDGSCIVASTIMLANGQQLSGVIDISIANMRLLRWSPGTIFWHGEYLGDFDPYPQIIAGLESAMRMKAAQIYPLVWRSCVPLESTSHYVGGTLARNGARLAHPDDEVISVQL